MSNGTLEPLRCAFIRDLCETTIENNPQELGGFNENGETIEVEINESTFFHRKYHSGQWRERHWVFGAVERRTRRCFLVEVPDRTAANLEPIIRRWILPGTHIISDGWAAYANIENIANGIYTHSVIVQERNFVDPIEPGVVEYFGTRINRNRFRNILGYFGTIPIYPPPSGRIFRNRQDISEPPPSLWDAQYLTLHNK